MMRDLQKDLDMLNKDYDMFDLSSALPQHEIEKHIMAHHCEWLERAIKAEALVEAILTNLDHLGIGDTWTDYDKYVDARTDYAKSFNARKELQEVLKKFKEQKGVK